jgi:hypothetical protein
LDAPFRRHHGVHEPGSTSSRSKNWWALNARTRRQEELPEDIGVRASFIANLAAGYYLTPHGATSFGDLVFYLSANLAQTIDGPSKNTVTLTPGVRTHLGQNWYLLGGVEVPVTSTKAFDYQVLGALMKVF